MNPVRVMLVCAAAGAALLKAQDDFLDPVENALALSAFQDQVRAQLSGTLDLEAYDLPQPTPGFIRTDGSDLVTPRLTLFLDGQAGPALYFFVQSRVDRGFDPGTEVTAQMRLDEYVLRFSPGGDPRFHIQIGKFATVVGNWTSRHDSWTNPFITAPLPYDDLNGIWDAIPARSTDQLQRWAHLAPYPPFDEDGDKYLRIPIIWGPSYASGAAAAGVLGTFDYAVEIKNTSLSSRPETWQPTATDWDHPTASARLGWNPDEMWSLGLSASDGPYLRASAAAALPPGEGLGAYREIVLGQDAAFAWHHFQAWAEVFETRYEIPAVANADTLAYYIEARYTFAPQFSGAIRWNQQVYATVPVDGIARPWGQNATRIDLAPAYRFTAHIQLKLQYSLQRGDPGWPGYGRLIAAQATLRF
jgi:hypothetical protein